MVLEERAQRDVVAYEIGEDLQRRAAFRLLRGAAAAYDREWLTSPAGESAYDKYREVLKLDSRNKEAREGIQRIGDRYVALGREALDRGDTEGARKYLAGAQKVTPKHAGIAELRTALGAASG